MRIKAEKTWICLALGICAASGLSAAALHFFPQEPKWPLFIAAFFLAGIAGLVLLHTAFNKSCPDDMKPLAWIAFVIPFASGGFYSFLSAPVSAFLLWKIIKFYKRNGGVTVYFNSAMAAVLALFIGYSFSLLWAVDSGMSVWGVTRYFPVLLFTVCIMQLGQGSAADALCLVPAGGAAMAAAATILRFIPALENAVTVNGRLSGFFEYPNTFAAFMLAGLVINERGRGKSRLGTLIDAALIFGVIESGSRTALILMLAVLTVFCIRKRGIRQWATAAGNLAACVLAALLVNRLAGSSAAERILGVNVSGSTFWGRLLYFKDALGQIARHPLGLGYYGYRAAQGGFQTGVYELTFVHNGLLQILLDVGWIPAILLCAAVIRAICSKNSDAWQKMLLLTLAAHSMMEFDFQFLAMWLLVLPLLQLRGGRTIRLEKRRAGPALALGAAILALTIWLGAGDMFYMLGRGDLCLAVTPFHTEALTERLPSYTDPDDMDKAADNILKLDADCSIAHSAKANAALARGDVLAMIDEKEKAIACARYSLAEYTDYFDKLYAVYQIYMKSGDADSAEFCRQKLLAVPDMLSALEKDTDKLAWKITDKPQFSLPEAETEVLRQLE